MWAQNTPQVCFPFSFNVTCSRLHTVTMPRPLLSTPIPHHHLLQPQPSIWLLPHDLPSYSVCCSYQTHTHLLPTQACFFELHVVSQVLECLFQPWGRNRLHLPPPHPHQKLGGCPDMVGVELCVQAICCLRELH